MPAAEVAVVPDGRLLRLVRVRVRRRGMADAHLPIRRKRGRRRRLKPDHPQTGHPGQDKDAQPGSAPQTSRTTSLPEHATNLQAVRGGRGSPDADERGARLRCRGTNTPLPLLDCLRGREHLSGSIASGTLLTTEGDVSRGVRCGVSGQETRWLARAHPCRCTAGRVRRAVFCDCAARACLPCGVGCAKSVHAARLYSWMSPPSRVGAGNSDRRFCVVAL
jgi:hypothetical protein